MAWAVAPDTARSIQGPCAQKARLCPFFAPVNPEPRVSLRHNVSLSRTTVPIQLYFYRGLVVSC